MLKKSLSVLLIVIMSLATFVGVASAAAPAAPAAPATVNGATYYLNKTFTANPSGTETLVEGASYEWFSKAANHSFSSEYNALGMNAKTSATFTNPISADGNYVVSVDFMAPEISFVDANGAGKNLSIQIGSYTACSIWNDNELYINGAKTSTKIVAGNWYRLATQIELPSGNVTVTLNNLTTGTLVKQASATGKVTTLNSINFNFPAVTTNMLYTQNWIVYKEKEKVPAPAAPADVTGVTYYMKNDFTARTTGTDAFNSNLSWAMGSSVAYNTDYKALLHNGYVQGNFTNALSTPGKYKFTMNFIVEDASKLTDEYRVQINGFNIMRIVNATESTTAGAVYLAGNTTSDYIVSNETWYTLEAVVTHPEKKMEVKVINHSTDAVVCSGEVTHNYFEGGINKIAVNNKSTSQEQLYTQSWRLYKLPNNFTAVDNGTTITASYILENASNAVIAVALYDETTKVMDSIDFVRYTNHTGVIKAEIAKKNGYTARAFLWNGDTFAPLFPSIDNIE